MCVYLNIHVHILTHKLCCRYGTYLSKEQVAELVAPHLDTLELLQIVPMNDFGMVRDELRRYLLYGFIYWPS